MGTTRSQKKLFFNLRKAKQRIGVYDNNELTEQQANELSDMLNVTKEEVRSMNGRLSGRDGSLNVTIGSDEDDKREWQDTIADESANHAEIYAETQEKEKRSRLLHQALDVLNEREADILSNRKLSDEPMTLEELSVRYSVSRERIRQIEEKAFDRSGAGCWNWPGSSRWYRPRPELNRDSRGSGGSFLQLVNQAFHEAKALLPEIRFGRIKSERRQQFPVVPGSTRPQQVEISPFESVLSALVLSIEGMHETVPECHTNRRRRAHE